MIIKKVTGCSYREIERLAKEVDVVIREIPTYIYKDDESYSKFLEAFVTDPSYTYTHPPLQGLLFDYEIWTSNRELAKRIQKTFGWLSIGKPLSIREWIGRFIERVWTKIRRGPRNIPTFETLYCLWTTAEKEEVERKLASLN
jgi:hypothetical protein